MTSFLWRSQNCVTENT